LFTYSRDHEARTKFVNWTVRKCVLEKYTTNLFCLAMKLGSISVDN